eukprot:763301-Hanusia_phi.AAC.6
MDTENIQTHKIIEEKLLLAQREGLDLHRILFAVYVYVNNESCLFHEEDLMNLEHVKGIRPLADSIHHQPPKNKHDGACMEEGSTPDQVNA